MNHIDDIFLQLKPKTINLFLTNNLFFLNKNCYNRSIINNNINIKIERTNNMSDTKQTEQHLNYYITPKRILDSAVKFIDDVQPMLDDFLNDKNNQKNPALNLTVFNILADSDDNISYAIPKAATMLHPEIMQPVLTVDNGILTINSIARYAPELTKNIKFNTIDQVEAYYHNEPIVVVTQGPQGPTYNYYENFHDFIKKTFNRDHIDQYQVDNTPGTRFIANEETYLSQLLETRSQIKAIQNDAQEQLNSGQKLTPEQKESYQKALTNDNGKPVNIFTITYPIAQDFCNKLVPFIQKDLMPKDFKFKDLPTLLKDTVLHTLCPTYRQIFLVSQKGYLPAYYRPDIDPIPNDVNGLSASPDSITEYRIINQDDTTVSLGLIKTDNQTKLKHFHQARNHDNILFKITKDHPDTPENVENAIQKWIKDNSLTIDYTDKNGRKRKQDMLQAPIAPILASTGSSQRSQLNPYQDPANDPEHVRILFNIVDQEQLDQINQINKIVKRNQERQSKE